MRVGSLEDDGHVLLIVSIAMVSIAIVSMAIDVVLLTFLNSTTPYPGRLPGGHGPGPSTHAGLDLTLALTLT